MSKPTVIDIFCGAGGLSEGFRQAGCKILAGVDADKWAMQTFGAAHKEAKHILGPIEKLDGDGILDSLGIKKGQLDFLVGGPPCQAFSINNHQRGLHDKRSKLFRSYLTVVEALQPKWIVLENVTGVYSAGDGKVVQQIKNGFESLGYSVECRTLKCIEHGVPQQRSRVIFIGTRTRKEIVWPNPSHGQDLVDFVSVKSAIGDLPRLKNGEGSEESEYNQSAFSEFQGLMRNGNKVLFNHVSPKLSEVNLKRMVHIPQGGNWRDIPRNLLPAGMKRAKLSDHTKRYGRLDPKGFSSTILTKCDIHWGAYIHPSSDRCLTVREAARFQSFPDHYKFFGSRVEQYKQVGNAVPPILAKAISEAILEKHYK